MMPRVPYWKGCDLAVQTDYVAIGEKTRIRRFTRADVDRWIEWPKHRDPLFEAYNPPSMSEGMRDAWYDDLVGRQSQLPFAVDDLEACSLVAFSCGICTGPRALRRSESTCAPNS